MKDTRSRILEAATTEFAQHGFGGARVDRIAGRAGANKRMLYYYFGSKDELFLAVLQQAYAHIRGAGHELDLEHEDPRQALKRLVEFTWRYYLEHPEFMSLLATENLHKASRAHRSRRVRRLHSPLVGTLRDILRRGERQRLFRAGVDPVQLYISIAGEGYFYLSPRELAGRARHVTDMVLNALRR